MTSSQQQQEALIKIRAEQEVPRCFGVEFSSKSNICKACFVYGKCQKFIAELGYMKKSKPGRKKKLGLLESCKPKNIGGKNAKYTNSNLSRSE